MVRDEQVDVLFILFSAWIDCSSPHIAHEIPTQSQLICLAKYGSCDFSRVLPPNRGPSITIIERRN